MSELKLQNHSEIHCKTYAFLELLDLCKVMPKNLSLNDQVRFLKKHYLDSEIRRGIGNDSNLSAEQLSFFIHNEKELLKSLNLVEADGKLQADSEKIGITPLIGSTLVFSNLFSDKKKTGDDFDMIAQNYNSLIYFYELWMIRNVPKQKEEDKSDSSITTKELWEQTRNQIKRGEFNYEKIPDIPFLIWPSEEDLLKYPAMEREVTESLDELEKTLIEMVPYFKVSTAVALLYTVAYLESLIKKLDKKHEPRILSIRVKLMKEIDEQSNSGCFIATCCYYDYNAPEVIVFRIYRDTILMNSNIGRMFVMLYYRISPMLVIVLSNSKTLNFLTKSILLTPFYRFLINKYKMTEIV